MRPQASKSPEKVFLYTDGTERAQVIRRLLIAGEIPFVEFDARGEDLSLDYDGRRYHIWDGMLVLIQNIAPNRSALPLAYVG
jgi:hypothetical protein